MPQLDFPLAVGGDFAALKRVINDYRYRIEEFADYVRESQKSSESGYLKMIDAIIENAEEFGLVIKDMNGDDPGMFDLFRLILNIPIPHEVILKILKGTQYGLCYRAMTNLYLHYCMNEKYPADIPDIYSSSRMPGWNAKYAEEQHKRLQSMYNKCEKSLQERKLELAAYLEENAHAVAHGASSAFIEYMQKHIYFSAAVPDNNFKNMIDSALSGVITVDNNLECDAGKFTSGNYANLKSAILANRHRINHLLWYVCSHYPSLEKYSLVARKYMGTFCQFMINAKLSKHAQYILLRLAIPYNDSKSMEKLLNKTVYTPLYEVATTIYCDLYAKRGEADFSVINHIMNNSPNFRDGAPAPEFVLLLQKYNMDIFVEFIEKYTEYYERNKLAEINKYMNSSTYAPNDIPPYTNVSDSESDKIDQDDGCLCGGTCERCDIDESKKQDIISRLSL